MNRRQFLQLAGAAPVMAALPRTSGGAVKCLAGWPGWDRCQEVGASFGYQWDNLDASHGKIPNVKYPFSKPWLQEDAIRAAARAGSIMVGNEWSLTPWSIDQHVDALKSFFDIVLDGNINCYILGPNDVVWEPYNGWRGFCNIEQVANRYKQRYGYVPPFRGFGFHAYHYPGGPSLVNMIHYAATEARRVYADSGDIDIHITETGSLVGQQAALDSMPLIRAGLEVGITAWFWFLSHDEPGDTPHPQCRIWDNWNLTPVGQAYKSF